MKERKGLEFTAPWWLRIIMLFCPKHYLVDKQDWMTYKRVFGKTIVIDAGPVDASKERR